ncbi:halocyanin domain-containing protein [Salinigranum marinum]|uniref:halocyanin domain-containing protein n=1 Tax=Salinigranum marinum TaxID=1515595 RepID=UPI002989BA0E|nr:halocyanin domain-containing protein [Salinigranum marinum]
MQGQTRRDLLRGGVAAGVALGAGAAAGPAAAQTDDYDGWLSDVDNYDGTTVDATGQDAVEVEVGAQGNGGTFAFAPPAVRVSPGTTVTFNWTSNTHNVLIEDQPEGAGWEGHSPIENTGFTLEHTFETLGVYKYYCEPHLSLGMKGVVVVEEGGGGGGGGPTVEADYGDWFSDVDNFDGTTEDLTGQDAVEVEVGAQGNGGTFAFAPPAVRVSPGTTVTFNWTSNTHNVLIEDQPEGAGWEGHSPIENTGFTYEHTFETPGVYTYYCEPHLSLGMKGAVVVGAAPGGGAGEGEASAGAIRLLQVTQGLLGVIFLAIVGVIAYVAVNRERYPAPEPDTTEREPTAEAAFEAPEVELEHDDFDPVGTFTVVLGYFVILVLMWVFMYFVEFLGNGPTVVG